MLQYGTSAGFCSSATTAAGVAQSVTKRATSPKAAFQQRDFRSSDKSWPAILPGDPRDVWIVEGGADALALQDLATRQGVPVPSVIVSGGANVLAFLERASVQKLLKQADRVTVAGKIKKSDKAQARADAGRQKQAERIKEITGRKVLRWWPEPEQGRDLAEQNAHQVEQVRERANRPAPRRAERTAPKFTLGASSNTVQGSDSDPAIRPPETPSVSPIEARRSARQGRSTPLHRPVAEGEPWTSEQAAESLQETLRQEQEDAEEQAGFGAAEGIVVDSGHKNSGKWRAVLVHIRKHLSCRRLNDPEGSIGEKTRKRYGGGGSFGRSIKFAPKPEDTVALKVSAHAGS